jgi:hypothetical protein
MDVCVFLLESSADIDPVERRGRTPLHYAAIPGFLPIVELLCDYGANALAVDDDDATPAILAMRRSSVAEYFASLGLDQEEEEDEKAPPHRGGTRFGLCGEFPARKEGGENRSIVVLRGL